MRVPRLLALLLSLLGAGSGAAAQSTDERPRMAGSDVPAPKRVKFVSPSYPAAAAARGLRGIVILDLVIDTQGKVASVDVVRSVPEFDESAVAAARQWEFEVTKVDGKPVPVRLTVPITFAMKLPEMRSAAGIPVLRQGVGPMFPAGTATGGGARVEATVLLDVDGRVLEAEVKKGESPYSDAVLAAIRTWRFAPVPVGRPLAFTTHADFITSGQGAPRVDLRLASPEPVVGRAGERLPPSAPPVEPAAGPVPAPSAGAPPPAPTAEPASPAGAEPPPAAPATTAPAPPPEGTPAPTPTAEPARPSGAEPPAPAPATTAPAPPPAGPAPGPPGAPAADPGTASAPAAPPLAPPPVEVIPAAPAPAEQGVSAVRDVNLGPGIPDLAKGRRPVVPPLARIQGVTGQVDVTFLVDAAGQTLVRSVNGPDLLKEAARQTVVSWSFRRTRTERLALKATFVYGAETVTATVQSEL
jgi:TonB family protein